MNPHSILSTLTQRMVLAGIGIMLFASSVTAQKETATERKNTLAETALAQVPERARVRKNPFVGDAQAAAAGGKLFQEHCANCHGEKAGGTRPGTSLLREGVMEAMPGTLFWIITNGVVRHGMPVWSKLPEPERWQIVTFIQSLKPQSLKSQSLKPQSAQPQGMNAEPASPGEHIP